MAASSMQSTKRRIKSVSSTMKITKAMELTAVSKLQKTKGRFEANREYNDTFKYCISNALAGIEEDETSKVVSDAKMYLVVSSNMGLCGGYNANIINMISSTVDKEKDYIVVCGTKAQRYLTSRGYKNVIEYPATNTYTFEDAQKIASLLVQPYLDKKVCAVKTIYTKYINSLTFAPAVDQLLPLEKTSVEGGKVMNDYMVIFEPSKKELLEQLLPLYFKNTIYSTLLESSVSEYASRRTAMENATDNAEELTEHLKLEYNKARQGAITQEITEVVAGANAL